MDGAEDVGGRAGGAELGFHGADGAGGAVGHLGGDEAVRVIVRGDVRRQVGDIVGEGGQLRGWCGIGGGGKGRKDEEEER